MVATRPVVDAPEGVRAAGIEGAEAVEVVVDGAVPTWLGEAVAVGREHGVAVVARLVADPARTPEQQAGWEIGALVVALRAGVAAVEGGDQRRAARVRTVVAAIATGTAPR